MKRIKTLMLVSGLMILSTCTTPSRGTTTASQTTSAGSTSAAATTAAETTAPVSTTTPATTPTETTSPATTFFPQDPAAIASFYPADQEVFAHLDNDGSEEKIFFSANDFRINEINYFNEVEDDFYLNESPDLDRFILVDLNTSDGQREIGLQVAGPSDDPETFFYAYQNQQLIKLGTVPDTSDQLDEMFDGQSHINGLMRLSLLQTWFAPATWQLTAANTIELVPDQIFVPKLYEGMGPVTLKIPLPIYENRGDGPPSATLQPQEVEFTATDDIQWVQIKAADGSIGWFKIEEFDYITDVSLHAGDVFDNLFSAD